MSFIAEIYAKWFAPKSHSHSKSDITDFGHMHYKADIADFAHAHSKSEITDFAHAHSKSEIWDFGHTHTKSDITDFAHTHTANQIVDFPAIPPSPAAYIVEAGMTDFTIDAYDGIMLTDDTLKKTYTGIYRKYNSGIYELYGVVPPIAQGVHNYHHLLHFPAGITFANCPNTNNNDSTKFMYTLVATQAFDANEATYQQYAFLVDTQYNNRVKFSIMATSQQAGFMFHLIGKLA